MPARGRSADRPRHDAASHCAAPVAVRASPWCDRAPAASTSRALRRSNPVSPATSSEGDLMKKSPARARRSRWPPPASRSADTLAKIKDSRQRSRWACANPPARCPTRWATASSSASTSRSASSVAGRRAEAARPGQAGHQVPAGDLAEPHPAGAERHRRHRVRLHHQQRHAPEGRGLRRHHLRRGSAHRGEGQLGHHLDRPAQRQERRHHHRHHLGADAAQARARRRRRLQGGLRQGPRRQLPAARDAAAPTPS